MKMNMSEKILLLSVFGNMGQTYNIAPAIDPNTGMYPDCCKFTDDKGYLMLTEEDKIALNKHEKYFIGVDDSIEVTSGQEFDLSKIKQSAQWEAIKNSNLIATERFEKDVNGDYKIDGSYDVGGTAYLYIYNPGTEVKRYVSNKKLKYEAEKQVFNSSEQKLRDIFAILGFDSNSQTSMAIQEILLKKCEENPSKIIELYENENLGLLLLVDKGIANNTITKLGGIYRYGSIMLGTSKNSVVKFLLDDKNLEITKQATKEIRESK